MTGIPANKIKELFWAALEQPKTERAHFLDRVCEENLSLRQELFSLLKSHDDAEQFLEQPVADVAAKLMKEERSEISWEQPEGLLIDGKYRIEKQLGQGGMGAVYQAIHLGTKRPVALKVIAPQFMKHNEFVERFKREAEAAGRLIHPNVVNVTDFGITHIGHSRIAYLVMEYLKGFTLGQLLKKRGHLPISFTIDILEQVCLAVDEAHKQGIIHRDLKPENIWLEPNGRGGYLAKVLDFGLAKLGVEGDEPSLLNSSPTAQIFANQFSPTNISLADQTAITLASISPEKVATNRPEANQNGANLSDANLSDASIATQLAVRDSAGTIDPRTVPQWLTRVGMVMGTPLYMSPEQCHGQRLDARSDIYALGVVAYEMLTGEPPFQGDLYQLIKKHTEMPPPPMREKRREIPSNVAELVMTALAKSPEDRFPNATAFTTALRIVVGGERPFIEQARQNYRQNFIPIFAISLLVHFPFIIINCLLMKGLLVTKGDFFGSSIVQVLWWLTPLFMLLLAGDINTALLTPFVEKHLSRGIYRGFPKLNLRILPSLVLIVLRSYLVAIQQGWKLILPAIRSYTESSFCASIAITENMKGIATMKRSQKLVESFFSLTFSLKLRSILVRIISFLLFVCTFISTGDLFADSQMNFANGLVGTILTALILPGLLTAAISPLVDMALAYLYFKTREAKGEALPKQYMKAEEAEIAEKLRFTTRRKVAMAFTLVVAMLTSGLSYYLMIPPMEGPTRIANMSFVKVAPEDNAWVEYDLAAQSVLNLQGSPREFSHIPDMTMRQFVGKKTVEIANNTNYGKLTDFSYGFTNELTDEQRAFLDSQKAVVDHVLAGAKRPKAQFNTEAISFDSPVPNLLQMRAITCIAVAQAHRLELEGRQKESIELLLATYRMSCDIEEPNSTLISSLIGLVCREIVSGAIFRLLNSGTTNAQTDIMIAQRIQEMNSRLATPYQLLTWEADVAKTTMYKGLINPPKNDTESFLGISPVWNAIKYFPGMRVRLFNGIVEHNEKFLADNREALAQWDFAKLKEYNNNRPQTAWELIRTGSPIVNAIASIFALNNAAVTRSIYFSNIKNNLLVAWASLAAYQKNHNQLPETLAIATKEAGVGPAIDSVTGKECGYRLENGKATLWFVGIDGKDDGGRIAYDLLKREIPVDGQDVIFNFGTMPLFYRPTTQQATK